MCGFFEMLFLKYFCVLCWPFPYYGFVKSVLVCAASSNNVRDSSEVSLRKTLV